MEYDNATERLQGLERDLIAFSENRLLAIERLSGRLDASLQDLKKLLEKKRRSEESRKIVGPAAATHSGTLKLGDVDYSVTDNFRHAALQVADELDLDEIEAAKLCIEVALDDTGCPEAHVPFRALLRFHNNHFVLLDCVRLLLVQAVDLEPDDEYAASFQEIAHALVRKDAGSVDGSAFWRKCIEGLTEVEDSIKKINDHLQTAVVIGGVDPDLKAALAAQRTLLSRQHEALGSILSYLIRSGHVEPGDFRSLLSKASSMDVELDVAIHYFPSLLGGCAYFGADESITQEAAKDLHRLFASGSSQLQWKNHGLKALTTVWWLAEYSARFADPTNTGVYRVADRQKDEEERTQLFMQSIKDRALHFLLAACQYLRPEIWYDPAKVGLVRYLLEDQPTVTGEKPSPSYDFALLVLRGLQSFGDAVVANMPDTLRRLKIEEDDQRRTAFMAPLEPNARFELHLERFMIIMSYAYQDDPEATQDFWADRESNLYGFLRWVSHRLPTPRVAAFCELLRSIANDEKSANQTHRFLLEETSTAAGKMRKTNSLSWSQILNELEYYSSSSTNRPALQQASNHSDARLADMSMDEPETYIMLEAYLRLAAHIFRISPDARNWILREQSIHIGEMLVHLASSGNHPRVHASCFDCLSALLTDKVPEVNDGMWVLIDSWITGGMRPDQQQLLRVQAAGVRSGHEKQYLQAYASDPETATGLVSLFHAMMAPARAQDTTRDTLPFPENLGAPNRHAGINAYVDFVMGTVFRSTNTSVGNGTDRIILDVLRCACLRFASTCLSTFNEDLVALANVTNLNVDSAMKTSSLSAYARLHPFARVMDWLFDNGTIAALTLSASQDVDELNTLDQGSPQVQAALGSMRLISQIMQLQSTYFGIVRPLIKTQATERSQPVANPAYASFDEVVLGQLGIVKSAASFAASTNVELSLAALELLEKFCASKKLGDAAYYSGGHLVGSRLVGALSDDSDALAVELSPYFQIFEWDLEVSEQPVKLIKAKAILDVLNSSLNMASGRPTVAHCLLGFDCQGRRLRVAPGSAFAESRSLFHAIATAAAQSPYAIGDNNVSWLLAFKRGCLAIVAKLSLDHLTSSIVKQELRAMDFLAAASQNQLPAFASPGWDQRLISDPACLLGSSASAIRDFLRARDAFFEYAAAELRTAAEQQAYSVLEKIVGALLGVVQLPDGSELPTSSIFDLFDFFDLLTTPASEVECRYLKDVDLSSCIKEDAELVTAFDIGIAEQVLTLKKRELMSSGTIKDADEEQQYDDEQQALLASLLSQNNWHTIQNARISALESWTDLFSLMLTAGKLDLTILSNVAQRGLHVVLPKLERALTDEMDSAALLAKLVLALVPAATQDTADQTRRNNSLTSERLLSTLRVCLRAIVDSNTTLALRDVCYRICCASIAALPLTAEHGKVSASANAKQLMQTVQNAGERLFTVVTEDAFSDRGVTRVSSLLFLDALLKVFNITNNTASLLRSLTKLNFLPVLLDQSIGNVASSFGGAEEELFTTVAYFHTALSLLLRICSTPEGTQLTLTSGFFAVTAESRLFTTDPDIGLDIDNPLALREFYRLLCAVLRVITAVVLARGPSNAGTVAQAKAFLQLNRSSMLAVFKRVSAVQKTSGPAEAEALEVADEFSRLMLVTGFLEEDEAAVMNVPGARGLLDG